MLEDILLTKGFYILNITTSSISAAELLYYCIPRIILITYGVGFIKSVQLTIDKIMNYIKGRK